MSKINLIPKGVLDKDPLKHLKSAAPEGTIAVYPRIHIIPKICMILGILSIFIQINNIEYEKDIDKTIKIVNILLGIFGIISVIGLLCKKKWSLICYFLYRFIGASLLILWLLIGPFNADIFLGDWIRLGLVIGVFFIKKDGHNVYDTVWNNGVFYERQV